MSMKQQAPNKQNNRGSLKDQLMANMVVEKISAAHDEVEQAYNTGIIGKMGFVKILPSKDNDKLSMVSLVGMVVVSGKEARNIQGYRRLKMNGNAARWFREAIAAEATNPTGMLFRVAVTGLSNSGKVAFVSPRAKNLENAKEEDKRLRLDIERAISRQDFNNDSDIARKAYEIYAKKNNLFIDRNYTLYDLPKDSVLMSTYDAIPTTYIVRGGSDVAMFIHGINKGTTTWEKEIEKNIVSTKVDPFYNNLKKSITNHA